MGCNSAELREKDVISKKDGRKLGFITDFDIDVSCGKIIAIFVAPFGGCFNFQGPKNEFRIPWEKIECIGEDAILVCPGEWSNGCETCQMSHRKRKSGWFF